MIISDNKKIKVQNYGLYAIGINKVVIVKGKTIILADPSNPDISKYPLAITLQYFEIGEYGEVLLSGTLPDINTNIYSNYVNTTLYLAANGEISATSSNVIIGTISKLGETGSIYINFNVEPSVSWGAITGTLSDQTDLQAALDAKFDLEDINPVCKLSENISKGQAVYISGATGTNMIASKASNDSESSSSKTFGILSYTGVTNDHIKVITNGFLEGVDTSTATIGDFIWLGVNGNLIFWHYPETTKPVAPAHLVFLGIVTRVHAVNGEIFVKVQNGYELDELHDVAVGDYVHRDVLYRDVDNNLWKNGSLFDLMGAASDAQDGYLKASEWTIFNDKQNAITLTTTGTSGAATFDGSTLNIPNYASGGSSQTLLEKAALGYEYYNDFLSTPTLSGTSDGSGYIFFFSGTSASVVASTAPGIRASNQHGFIRPTTGSQSTGYAGLYGGSGGNQFLLGGGAMTFTTSVLFNTLSTSTERYRVTIGYGDQATSAAEVNGIFFTYDEGGTANGTTASANWQCVTTAGSVRTLTTSTVAINNTAWCKLSIEINAAGTSVAFYIDNTLVATHTTNIPSGAVQLITPRVNISKTIGVTSRFFHMDYIYYAQTYTTTKPV